MLNMVNFVVGYGRSLAPWVFADLFCCEWIVRAQAEACALFASLLLIKSLRIAPRRKI